MSVFISRYDTKINFYAGTIICQAYVSSSIHYAVGDAKTRGISGGEKKRLSIGNELICLKTSEGGGSNNNSRGRGHSRDQDVVIFADEPTTGLDSYQALKVVEILRVSVDECYICGCISLWISCCQDLARDEGYTVVASIHQPRTSIFDLFDELTLMR
jgi:hypothetical protein